MTDLDILFNSYLMQQGKTKTMLAEHLNLSLKTISRMWKAGINTWRWDEVIKAAQYIGIPIDTLREMVRYRKEKK